MEIIQKARRFLKENDISPIEEPLWAVLALHDVQIFCAYTNFWGEIQVKKSLILTAIDTGGLLRCTPIKCSY